MSKVTCHLSISLDGFVAGPNQSLENPVGEGGGRVHEWLLATAAFQDTHADEDDPSGADDDNAAGTDPVDDQVATEILAGAGAFVMGRNMFGPDRGEWDLDWHGWWGDEPPYHAPVYVLGHRPRPDLEMAGGTTFHFVTDGPEAALARAREAAGDLDVSVAGGASTVRQLLAAGLVDEVNLDLTPVVLGAGERLLGSSTGELDRVHLRQVRVLPSSTVTHLRYEVVRQA